MVVTGVDPLLDIYAIVRERHGLSGLPAIGCAHEICAGAEHLREVLPPAFFDLAYCANALDHVADPAAVIDGLAHVLRPGGLLVVEVFTREGSRENWWQLHQFDMYANEAGEFVCETRDGAVRTLLRREGALRLQRFVSNTADTTWVVAERAA
jgi:SAM-dependent methyltransferase